MESEQFSLCWNNFHSTLSSGFNTLLQDECFVDVTLAAAGKYVKAHRTILSVCSPFFKDLFQANPSKHPIVILPEVDYNALTNLLKFMYQGEVSVHQDEIPTFMRVAEMLKVKGLTDNNPGSNGYNSSSDSRPPPAKRVRNLKNVGRSDSVGNSSPSSQSSLRDRSPIERAPSSNTPTANRMVRCKTEPVDPFEASGNAPAENPHFDLASMLDTKLGESPGWMAARDISISNNRSSPDPGPATPGTLQCILGRRGNPRLIVDGFSFYKKSVYKGKAFWYCKQNRTPDKCPAVCWTMNGNIVKWPNAHTHMPIAEPFNPEEDCEVPIQNLQEVLWQTSINKFT